MPSFPLRDYQQECVDIINNLKSGAHLVHMATGLGKTVVFSSIERKGRVLILSHRDELVRQPIQYYDCPVGVEKAQDISDGEEVISASVQSLSRDRRLKRFNPGDFDTIITDEAHHALAPTYRKIVEYFEPRLHIGFTATPKRGDERGLNKVFEDIVYSKDLKWGIKHGWLADIDCQRVYVEWNTKKLHRQNGDYKISELDAEVNTETGNDQIAAAYQQFAEGPTLVFAATVDHAYQLAKRIPNSAVVDGKMSQTERRATIEAFRNGEIECLLNYGVFTEGTDLPMIRTVLLARPTQNVALYTQMVGRGLRLDEKHGKTSVKLIDCVGTTTDNRLCTAPTLFGLNEEDFPENAKSVINGSLMELEDRLEALENTPRGWVLRARKVDVINNLFVAWVTTLSGSRVVSGNTFKVEMSPEDDLGGVDVTYRGYEVTTRHYEDVDTADIAVYRWLNNNPLSSNEKRIWDKDEVKRWGSNPATASQVSYMRSLLKEAELDYELDDLLGISRGEASIVIANAKAAIEAKKAEELGTCPLCGSALRFSKSEKSVMCSQLHWKKDSEGEWYPAGICTFRFFRTYNSQRIAKKYIKDLATLKPIKVNNRFLRLEQVSGDDEYEIFEIKTPSYYSLFR